MIIKSFEQGILIGNGQYICHVKSEGGGEENDFPPVLDQFALGSTWEDTSESGEEVMTVKYELKKVEDSDPAWYVIDPMTLDTDETLYDVSNVKHAYVEIAEDKESILEVPIS